MLVCFNNSCPFSLTFQNNPDLLSFGKILPLDELMKLQCKLVVSHMHCSIAFSSSYQQSLRTCLPCISHWPMTGTISLFFFFFMGAQKFPHRKIFTLSKMPVSSTETDLSLSVRMAPGAALLFPEHLDALAHYRCVNSEPDTSAQTPERPGPILRLAHLFWSLFFFSLPLSSSAEVGFCALVLKYETSPGPEDMYLTCFSPFSVSRAGPAKPWRNGTLGKEKACCWLICWSGPGAFSERFLPAAHFAGEVTKRSGQSPSFL